MLQNYEPPNVGIDSVTPKKPRIRSCAAPQNLSHLLMVFGRFFVERCLQNPPKPAGTPPTYFDGVFNHFFLGCRILGMTSRKNIQRLLQPCLFKTAAGWSFQRGLVADEITLASCVGLVQVDGPEECGWNWSKLRV